MKTLPLNVGFVGFGLAMLLAGCDGKSTGDSPAGDTNGSDESGDTLDSEDSIPTDSPGGDDTGDSGSTTPETCVSDEALAAIATHVDELGLAASMLLGHGSPREAIATFLVPGYQGVLAQYASLVEACSEPLTYDEWCEQDLCWQLECPGGDASNISHGWLADAPLVVGGWTLEAATADTLWSESTGDITVTLASTETSPEGEDLSVEGLYVVPPDGVGTLTEQYPGLLAGGATLTATLDVGGSTVDGDLEASGVVVARFYRHTLMATGDCP